MKKMSLRLRLTLISVILLLLCCLGLTLFLNHAAGNMADTIEAMPILTPAQPIVQENAEAEASPGKITVSPDTSQSQEIGLPVNPPAEQPSVSAASSLSPASHEARQLFIQKSYLYMFVIVLAGGLLTWFITGRALRPLGRLSEEMQGRTVQNLSDELPVPESDDEIASLTRSFNEMNRKLDEAFSAQKRFAQSAAHELRTPLTVLKAKVDVFGKKTDHTPEEYTHLLLLVKTQTDRMAALVNDLLGLTNLDDLSCNQTVSLKTLLGEVIQELTQLAAEKNVSLHLNAENCQTTGNHNLLYRAFSNLVENAIKYNISGGTVTVNAFSEKGMIFVRITDTGTGIPDDRKTLIFEPFYRIDKSRSRKMGGAGLGLATVKAILEKHNGGIHIEDGKDGGSVFVVTLKETE